MKRQGGPESRERELPARKDDPGMRETDDHVMDVGLTGGAQPVDGLDLGVADEHVKSPSQGVRPER